ncbi:UvrD-helicase domain-containing protein [Paenibacillus thermotolerans]|uniref:UvrD-helicase domain-containing protein n=1 Tax=Paenibacillus thermotolerans TaxID=3027807 RepID=UPI002367F114|nr:MULTISPECIES: UvrD-helicase domain-containing protein [unclassified Paenibacillus]
MVFTKISPSNSEKEQKSINEIFNYIDKSESIIFNSGAGAGKTYALIESLKYVIRNYNKNLKKHNQQIICITYTNVATREVKERLGNSDLVLISTIHERIWSFIKNYQKQLVEIHKEKLEEEITSLEQKIKSDDEYVKYRELDEKQKDNFKKIMFENNELFYQNYSVKAAEFKKTFQTILSDFSNILNNVGHFKKIVSTIYKLDKYRKSYENIISKKPGYSSVEYNSIYNSDQLEKMRISHDTLLDYGLRIIERYDLLKQIIIDKYPFIFIDEYQDTDEKVVQIMSYLENYAEKINRKNFIGYFGDTAQNIYDDGVGSKITEIHTGLVPIYKEYNRRSTKEVIEVINEIRNDNIKQISIYDDCEGGSVKFYSGTSSDVRDFIEIYVDKWNVTLKNQLHCLVLTNKTVAEYTGFSNIYEGFKETNKYKGANYNQLNTELLSNDLSKLGEVPKLIFNIVKLHNCLLNNTPVIDISPKESLFDEMSFIGLRVLINSLKQINGKTLGEYIASISAIYAEDNDKYYKKLIDWTFGFENVSCKLFKNYLAEKLFYNMSNEDIDHANATINKLLEISIDEYELWYKFIIEKQSEKVIYHTYHGTKGREFENVIIIMENAFGKSSNYFNFFFENIHSPDGLNNKDKQNFEKIKNLLYVSCSRAIKNLRILYIDDTTNFESGIRKIFAQIYPFKV